MWYDALIDILAWWSKGADGYVCITPLWDYLFIPLALHAIQHAATFIITHFFTSLHLHIHTHTGCIIWCDNDIVSKVLVKVIAVVSGAYIAKWHLASYILCSICANRLWRSYAYGWWSHHAMARIVGNGFVQGCLCEVALANVEHNIPVTDAQHYSFKKHYWLRLRAYILCGMCSIVLSYVVEQLINKCLPVAQEHAMATTNNKGY
jgi:hypothetical protein